MKRLLPVFAVVLALGLAACTPSTKPAPSPSDIAQGFDTCAAPSTDTMTQWWASSPYSSIGIYVGGANMGCAQPNLTATWVTTVTDQGWALLPIWVGPQASCTTLSGTTTMSSDAFIALVQGYTEGTAAADRMTALGFPWLAPVYYDLEAYPQNSACTAAAQSFMNGWTYALNTRGYLAGMYSSLCSGILDQLAGLPTAKYVLNAIWIAAWNNTPNIFGFGTGSCALSDDYWAFQQRVHQFKGGHNETWGNVTVNIDSDAVDGPTYTLQP